LNPFKMLKLLASPAAAAAAAATLTAAAALLETFWVQTQDSDKTDQHWNEKQLRLQTIMLFCFSVVIQRASQLVSWLFLAFQETKQVLPHFHWLTSTIVADIVAKPFSMSMSNTALTSSKLQSHQVNVVKGWSCIVIGLPCCLCMFAI